MAETKQGLEVIVKFVHGDAVNFTDYVPTAPIAADVTFTYKRNVDWNWNYNVRPIHNAQGSVTHHKGGIPAGTLSLSALFMDATDWDDMRTAVTGSSVPWGYLEVQYLDTTGAAVEFVMRCKRIVFSGISVSNPEDDSTESLDFILYECPSKQVSSKFS